MIKCPNCGAQLKYNISTEKVECEYCGTSLNPDDKKLKANVATNEKLKFEEVLNAKSYRCANCGAKLLTFDETAATFCNYCGSENMLEDKMMTINKPELVIPFKITKEEAIKIYNRKVKKNFLIPKYMKDNMVLEKIHGIYMPYGIYTLEHHGKTKNRGSKYWKHRGNYDYYKDYDLSLDVDAKVEGLSYDLVSNFYDQYSYGIAPYNYNEAKEFNLNYVSGFYADSRDLETDLYQNEARGMAESYLNSELKKERNFSKYGCASPKANLTVTDKKVGMFPVYFLSFRNTQNNTISYAVINGQTGKMAADMPIDMKKYLLLSLIVSIIGFILINGFLSLNCKMLVIIAGIISLISLIISLVNLKNVTKRKNYSEDIGMVVKEKENKNEKISKRSYILKQIIGIILGIIVYIYNPIYDLYFYIVAIIMFILNILSFRNIVKEHNLLTTRPIPQLEKRGGESK